TQIAGSLPALHARARGWRKGHQAIGRSAMPSFRHPLTFALALALPTGAAVAETAAPLTLEQRVLQLEAEKEIREVVVKYGEYLDARDYAGYASLFASNGMWTGGFGSATGPAAIEEMLKKNL